MIRTERLVLRRWRTDDKRAFAALNDDPEVMRHMPRRLDRVESDAWADAIEHEFMRDGFGLWALELPGKASFIGFTGLNRVGFAASFTPAVEIGWRLAPGFWGQGYATEAARAAVRAGFRQFGLQEIVAETSETNFASRRVMERLGMRHDPGADFDHPQIALGHPFRRYVFYRLHPTRDPEPNPQQGCGRHPDRSPAFVPDSAGSTPYMPCVQANQGHANHDRG